MGRDAEMAIATLVVTVLVVQWLALGLVLSWGETRTRGNAYFGLPLAARRRFKRVLRLQATLLAPILWAMRPLARFDFGKASFTARGLAGPRGSCTPASFEAAMDFVPAADDIIVASQMKCGTTWLLYVVYQVLYRGRGTLVEDGHALHGLTPWLEGVRTVPVNDAPRVGVERPSRIIKTHLPGTHCPRAPMARFLYVTRHPIACFASTTDFVRAAAHPYPPSLAQLEAWFTGPETMWWGTWPAHAEGWWTRAATDGNVLFLHYEEMQADLPAVTQRIATFLGMAPLSAAEVQAIAHACSFAEMRRHADAFEMHPPHLGAPEPEGLRHGTSTRDRDVPRPTRERLAAWCRAAMREGSYPLTTQYPDLASPLSPEP